MPTIVPYGSETSAYWDGVLHFNSAQVAEHHGWTVGTKLAGDEGYGPSIIQITAIGECMVLAKTLESPYGVSRENSWSFTCRDWQVVA